MASITRRWKKFSALLALAVAALAWSVGVPAAQGDAIEIKRAALVERDDGYTLEADFEIQLTATLEDALGKGVSLAFLFEWEVLRPRWYWLNERVAGGQLSYRLSYQPLTRQYRVTVGQLFRSFATLDEAVGFISRIRRQQAVESDTFRKDQSYQAAVRLRLDISQLPKPFQVNALASREWNIGSDWFRWTFTGTP
ncbi:MAG: DUF4390 domain-containing protein [Burkholderiales bacterium]